MHRVPQHSFFQNAGWDVTVLTVQQSYRCKGRSCMILVDACEVIRVKAFPLIKTRKFGLGNLGYSHGFQLKKAGDKF